MPKIRQDTSYTTDTTFFSKAIDRFVKGRVTIESPTISDYFQHYGSKKALATHYAEVNNLKYDTARKQIERMLQKPHMKLKPETVSRLGKLQVSDNNVVISITGWYTYDNKKWEFNTFSNVRRPFSASEMREIISATRSEGQQAGIDKFMELYGVHGLYPTFATEGLVIDIYRM